MTYTCDAGELDRARTGQDVADLSIWPYFGDCWTQRSNVISSLER